MEETHKIHDSLGRIGGISVADVAMTAGGALLLSRASGLSFWTSFFGLVVVGEVVHYAMNIKTPLMKTAEEIRGRDHDGMNELPDHGRMDSVNIQQYHYNT